MKPILAIFCFALSLSTLAAEVRDTPITLETNTGAISGSLMTPDGKTGLVALIIAGSGPTDRDGNSKVLPGKNDSLKMLARALSQAGIASVRYDKRSVGQSVQTPETDLRFDSYVEDAENWVKQLKRDDRFTRVAVIGHSEGSLIGMLAARTAAADAYVSIAGPAQGAASLLRQQLAGKLPPDLARFSETTLRTLESGGTVENVPAPLNSLYRRSVQPYMISWFKYVPADEFKRLQIPTLVLQGDTDIQVGIDQARALQAANPKAQLVIVPGMNHVLKQVPADPARQTASYSDPSLPVSPELIEPLVRFLGSTFQTATHRDTTGRKIF